MKGLLAPVLCAAALAVVGACASGTTPVSPAEDIDVQIRAARTASDHEAVAARLDRQARELAAKARDHEVVARSYSPFGFGANDGIWMRHCISLAEKMRAAAADSAALAAAHRDQAALPD